MKRKRGCESCRSRHRKCVFKPGADVCYGCREARRPCISASKFVFVTPPRSKDSASTATASASSNAESESFNRDKSSDAVSPAGEPQIGGQSSLGLTHREADLFSLYLRRLGPMMDSCDEARHFTLTVPRLALQEPMLLHSILALASRYDALHQDATPDLDATLHNSRCIELLIQALAKPPETYGAELLAAVVISRSYEECDFDADLNYHHLSGTKNLLVHEAISRLASGGGLAEAASWVHLRQAIYACLVRRQPIHSTLHFFDHLTAVKLGEVSHANQMVYLFARLLRLYFPSGDIEQAYALEDWDGLQGEVTAWFDAKPASFEPIYSVSNAGTQQFPVMIMTCAESVMGLQYYYASTIVFAVRQYEKVNPCSGLETARMRKKLERSIASALFILMGLAISNDHVEDAFLLPTHILSLCGFCIQTSSQREKTLGFLAKVKEKIYWTTDSLVASLSEYWAEVDGVGDD
ncbi:hypothetical protein ACJ41O_012029 [Fusarium nematophilum]